VPSSGVAPESERLGGARLESCQDEGGLPARSRTSNAWLRRPGPESRQDREALVSMAGVVAEPTKPVSRAATAKPLLPPAFAV
jgi:hypothetical protein